MVLWSCRSVSRFIKATFVSLLNPLRLLRRSAVECNSSDWVLRALMTDGFGQLHLAQLAHSASRCPKTLRGNIYSAGSPYIATWYVF
jgi:hypothetical protein